MTIVVALNKPHYANQLLNATGDDFYYNGTRVMVHSDPVVTYNARGEANANFDVVINCDPNYGTVGSSEVFCGLPHHHIKPLDKYKQSVYFDKLGNGLLVPMYSSPCKTNQRVAKHNTLLGPHWSKKDYIIKSLYGARGVGQVLVRNVGYVDEIDPSTIVSLFTMDGIKLDHFINSYPDRIVYNTDGEVRDNEGMQLLINSDWYVQEYVPDIISEIRVVTDHNGEIAYIQKRAFKDDSSYKQAIGSDVTKVVDLNTKEDTVVYNPNSPSLVTTEDVAKITKHLENIKALLSKDSCNPFPTSNCSFDFFINSDGELGFLEMSTQYGTMGMSRKLAIDINQDYIRSVIKYYIERPASVKVAISDGI